MSLHLKRQTPSMTENRRPQQSVAQLISSEVRTIGF